MAAGLFRRHTARDRGQRGDRSRDSEMLKAHAQTYDDRPKERSCFVTRLH